MTAIPERLGGDMINKKTIRRKLMLMLLLVSFITLVTAVVINVVLRQRSAALYAQSESTNNWLKGQVVGATDKRMMTILESLSGELARSREDFKNPVAKQVSAPLYGMTLKEGNKPPGSEFELPVKDDRVLVNFKGGGYYQFDGTQYTKEDGKPPDNNDYLRDQKCYKTFLYTFFKAVEDVKIESGKDDVNTALRKYSDAIFEKIGVDKVLTNKPPSISIIGIFAYSTNGTMTIFPWNSMNLAGDPRYKLKERKWYLSALGTDGNERGEILPFPNNGDPSASFGLSPIYIDAVSKEYARTLWHKFTVVENGHAVTYVLCIDLVPSTSLPPSLFASYLPSWAGKLDNFTESLLLGLISGLAVFSLGSILVLLLSTFWPNLLSIFLVRRKPDAWVNEETFIPISQAFASRRSITFTNVVKNEDGVERKVSFAAWFQMTVAKLTLERNSYNRESNQGEYRDEVTLDAIDKDPSLRGFEVWRVFRSRWRSEGGCRLCDQEVKYKESDKPIAEPTIRHRRAQLPSIDTRLAANSSVSDTKSLEDSITWQATDMEPKTLGMAYRLTSAPVPRIPQTIQELNLFKDTLKTFQMLSQSRIEVNDCVELSIDLFRNRNVRAVCHIDYFRKIASGGESSLAALRQGQNIERILVANKPEDMVDFLTKYRQTIESLLKARNQELFRLYLDDTGVDFNTFGNQRFDLDFAIVYGENEVPLVLASNLSELNSGSSVKGYLSWRKVDVFFFQTLYESFIDKRVTLRLDDLPLADSVILAS
jgi:hypothetical protein